MTDHTHLQNRWYLVQTQTTDRGYSLRMLSTKWIKTLALILLILFPSLSFGWPKPAPFESGTNGQLAEGVSGWDDAYFQTYFSTDRAHTGTKSCKGVWATGETSTVNADMYLSSPVTRGGEIWFRAYHYFATPWSWDNSAVVKVMRIHGDSGGMLSLFAGNTGGSNGNITLSNEPATVQTESSTPFGTNTWMCLEIYVKYDNPGIIRICKNGILVLEDTSHATYTGGSLDFVYYMSYWNGGAPQIQTQYVDDVVLTTDTPSNVDASGNHMVGPTDWGGGDTSAPVMTLVAPTASQVLSYGTTSTTVSLATDESATCKWDTSDISYASMTNTYTTTGATSHSRVQAGLTNGGSYTYYTRCSDSVPNVNTSSLSHSFSVSSTARIVYLSESFDNTSWAARGGGTCGCYRTVDTSTKYSGTASLPMTWTTSSTTPFAQFVHSITPGGTDSLYISFYWRCSSGWVGSGQSYHPHIIHIFSDLDVAADYPSGMIPAYGDTLFEPLNLTPHIKWQDASSINSTLHSPPWTNAQAAETENRATGGCNGVLSGSSAGNSADCYQYGGVWYNMRDWTGTSNFSLSTWHHVEIYQQMNTITSNHGNADGIMWVKVDDNYVVNSTNVIYRTNQHPTMKWEAFFLAPYIGDGSPANQTLWIDSLNIANAPPSDTTPPTISCVSGAGFSVR